MFGSDKNSNYEAVPDVEKGALAAHGAVGTKQYQATKITVVVDKDYATQEAKNNEQYANLNLNDHQARLLGSLDQAINSTNGGDLFHMLPAADSEGTTTAKMEDLEAKIQCSILQAKEFTWSLLQPTITAVLTIGMALYLRGQQESSQLLQKADSEYTVWSATVVPFLVRFFPYVNATIVFVSTAMSIQQRLMEAMVNPTFDALDGAQEALKQGLAQLGPVVDETIDGIQEDFENVLIPIQPKLDQISGKAHLLEQVLEKRQGSDDIDIPDPSDIQRELDEMQGLVTGRMDQVEDQLQFESYVPTCMRSPKHFYWNIVLPILVSAWIVQMLVAYAGSGSAIAMRVSPTSLSTPVMGYDGLRRNLKVDLESHLDDEGFMESGRDDKEDADSDSTPNTKLPNITTTTNKAKESYEDYKPQAGDAIHTISTNITDRLHGYEHDGQDQYQKYKDEFEDDILLQSHTMVRSVLWSYGMAVLQMLFAYLFANEATRAWIVRQGMKHNQKGAMRTLDDCGVTAAMEDIFGTRIPNVRKKIVRLIKIYKKAEELMDKTATLLHSGAVDRFGEAMNIQGMQDNIPAVKGKNVFSKFFKSK